MTKKKNIFIISILVPIFVFVLINYLDSAKAACDDIFQGYAYNSSSGECEFRSVRVTSQRGCFNPFPYETMEECLEDNPYYGDLSDEVRDMRLRLEGRILLQVEEDGQVYYITPDDLSLHFLGRPADAFEIMRGEGVGISNEDILKIPASLDYLRGEDSDGDGLPDDFERAFGTDPYNPDTDGDGYTDKEEIKHGYDPLGPGKLPLDENFAQAQAGRILLQVERNGEAWYVNPENNHRYFLGRPADAFEIMRNLGLGISNQDFNKLD